MSNQNKINSLSPYLVFQILSFIMGIIITLGLLILEPTLKNLTRYISVEGLWIIGMLSLATSALFGLLNKDKTLAQSLIVVSLLSLVTLLLNQTL